MSFIQIFNASTARIPFVVNSITYVFSLTSEQLFSISITSFFDIASLFLLTAFGNFTFNLNFLGLISISLYSKKFLTVTTLCFIVIVDILQSFLRYPQYLLKKL